MCLSVALGSNSTVIDFPYKPEELALNPGRSWGWLWCMYVLKMSWNCRRSEKNLPGTLCSYSLVSRCVGGGIKAHKEGPKHIIRCYLAAQVLPGWMSLSNCCAHFWFTKFLCTLERQMNYWKRIRSSVRIRFTLKMHADVVFLRSKALAFALSVEESSSDSPLSWQCNLSVGSSYTVVSNDHMVCFSSTVDGKCHRPQVLHLNVFFFW